MGFRKEFLDATDIIKSFASEEEFDAVHIFGSGYEKINVTIGNDNISAEKISLPYGDILLADKSQILNSASSSKDLFTNDVIYMLSEDSEKLNKENDKRNSDTYKYLAVDIGSFEGGTGRSDNILIDDDETIGWAIRKLEKQLESYKAAKTYFQEIVYNIFKNTNGATDFSKKGSEKIYREFSGYLNKAKAEIPIIEKNLEILKSNNRLDESFSRAIFYANGMYEVETYWDGKKYDYQIKTHNLFDSKILSRSRKSPIISVGCGWYAAGFGIHNSKEPILFYDESLKGRNSYFYNGIEFLIYEKSEIKNSLYENIKDIEGCAIAKEYKYQKKNHIEKRKGEVPKFPESKSNDSSAESRQPLTFDQFKKMTEKPEFDWRDIEEVELKGLKVNHSESWKAVCETNPDHPMCKYYRD